MVAAVLSQSTPLQVCGPAAVPASTARPFKRPSETVTLAEVLASASVSSLTLMVNVRDMSAGVSAVASALENVTVTLAEDSLPSSSSPVECCTAPTTAVKSLLVTSVISGVPSPASPIVKSTVVAVPVPNTSPLQCPSPDTSASEPARVDTL